MAKEKQQRRLAGTEAKAVLSRVKSSRQKADLVLAMIRGKKVESALAELTFSIKGVAPIVKGLLESAIANAENNHDLDVDSLYVKEAYADKNIVLKRWKARARGRTGKILKPRSNMTIIVAEKAKKVKVAKKAETKTQATGSEK